ncbi:sugar phosphate isomerase/epimerase family protein [Foetidibacter luteolus]|uniref:sugar phosphate isomerase/epimerase family protein n=1 Tax=Foetidibacter luteolus TaxID=2608880 RepID=UPI00129AD368|nr:sugar phosphate isomerase/epimerase family protein [Foetidibacter luteolus]
MKQAFYLLLASFLFAACNNGASSENNTSDTAATAGINPQTDWKFGIALWTFHTFNFPQSLDKVDSAGLKYIEPNTFHATGPELKDSLVMQLSPAGIDKLKSMIAAKGLTCESIYIAGDTTLASWKKQFDIAKGLGVQFVTAEPPINMWDGIDSLAGAYGIKVAIHEHWKGVSQYWNPDTVLLAIQGHPNFGACADLGHWPKSGINPVDAVKKLSGHIIGIHLKDIAAFNDPALKDVPVGTGVVDFPAVFAELRKQNFKGHIYIERDAEDQPSNLPSVIQTVKYYNEQVAKLK